MKFEYFDENISEHNFEDEIENTIPIENIFKQNKEEDKEIRYSLSG